MAGSLVLALSLTNANLFAGGGWSAEAQALFARFTTPPTAQRKTLINDLIVALKAAGVWSKLDAFYILAAADAQSARQNWIADQFNLTAVSGPTFAADRGYTGDGAASYLRTGYTPSTAGGQLTLNSAHLGHFSRTSGQGATIEIAGRASSTSQQLMMQVRNASDQFNGRVNQDDPAGFVSNADGSGHFVASRTAAAVRGLYRNAALLATSTEVSTVLPPFELYALAGNTNGSAASFSVRQLSAIHIGGGLNAQNVTDLRTALVAYLTAVGAA